MRRVWGWLSSITLIGLLAVTLFSAWAVRDAVRGQENRLLHERANEVSLVLKEATDAVASELRTVGGVLQATDNSPAAFRRAGAAIIAGSKGRDTLTLLHRTASGYRVELVDGDAFAPGARVPDSLAATLTHATDTAEMVSTPVMGAGASRTLGLAFGPPVAPPGTLLYLQVGLGLLHPPTAASSDAFHELRVVLYGTSTADPTQALVSTTAQIPLRGNVRTLPFKEGSSTWTLQVSAAAPLVGAATAHAAWFVLGGGILLSFLLALVIEVETRRRRSAVALYRSEHRLAEALQRSLLPSIPAVERLELAACYLPGSAGQEVGGDWYDAFELEGGRVGLAIGDVLGHDIEAAALMSQIQTALRAYALLGERPGAVLDCLEPLLASLGTERLVTVFYGVLGPAAEDGSREFEFANAGHPAPLLREAGGTVTELDGASSLLLGVSALPTAPRSQCTRTVPAGSTLVFYTDGLIELPGEALSERLELLKAEVSTRAAERPVSEVCNWLLERVDRPHRRDDVAILLARLPHPGVQNQVRKAETRRRERWAPRRRRAKEPAHAG